MHTPFPNVHSLRRPQPHLLHEVVNDTLDRLYSGPCVVAAIAGVTVSEASDALRYVRYGMPSSNIPSAPPLNRTTHQEIEHALWLFGFLGSWRSFIGERTLTSYLKGRSNVELTFPCVVALGTQHAAVNGNVFCDVFSGGRVVDINEAPGRRKRVSHVLSLMSQLDPSDVVSKANKFNAAGISTTGA